MNRYAIASLTILLGAIPASLLAILAAGVGMVSGPGLIVGPWPVSAPMWLINFALTVWCLLALWGTYGLWAAAIETSPIYRVTAAALIGGVVAMLAAFLVLDFSPQNVIGSWLLVFPMAVALWHLWQWRCAEK